MKTAKSEATVLECTGTQTKDWYAWIDLMPPSPYHLHVVGEVLVPNPGVDPLLTPREPQGINPTILLLDLHLIQKPGMWPQLLVWKQVRYDKLLLSMQRYKQVQVFCGNTVIADLPVQEAQ